MSALKSRFAFAGAAIGVLVVAVAVGSSAPATAYDGEALAPQTTVTMAQARTISLKARPGKITGAELEKERGGSGLRYSFDIRSGGKTWEVGVDARTGKVLENDREGPDAD